MAINLSKGQTINLSKEATLPGGLRQVRLGLGWDVAQRKGLFGRVVGGGSIDLDASALMISGGQVRDIVYFGQLTSHDGAVHHTGDNLTGAGDGDDESILVDLTQVHPSVEAIVFTVNSYQGQSFDQVENAYVRVVDSQDRDRELARFSLSGSGSHTGLIMGVLARSGQEWTFRALGEAAQGRTAAQLQSAVLRHL